MARKFKWRKWNRAVHRDLGYFFFGITIIYAISGIAINHADDWNPNYMISRYEFNAHLPDNPGKDVVKQMLTDLEEEGTYKKHFFPQPNHLKVFIKNGTVEVNMETGIGILEKVKKRPIIKEMNYLHYNPVKWWTIYSDIYVVALLIISISGLFILKGPKGITKRGAWLTIVGILIPLVFLWIYM